MNDPTLPDVPTPEGAPIPGWLIGLAALGIILAVRDVLDHLTYDPVLEAQRIARTVLGLDGD